MEQILLLRNSEKVCVCVCVMPCVWLTHENTPLSDLVKLLWVVNEDLDSHLHLGLLQAEVQAGNLSVDHTFHHAFGHTDNMSSNIRDFKQVRIHNLNPSFALWNLTLMLKQRTCFHPISFFFLARKEVPQFIEHCNYILFKVSLLSTTRITAHAIRTDIAANLNGSCSTKPKLYDNNSAPRG